jgi:hypothetical protein
MSPEGKFFQESKFYRKISSIGKYIAVCAGEPSHGTTGSLPPFPAFPFPFPGLPPLPGLFPFEPPQPAFSQPHQHQPANRKSACEADFQPKFPEFLIPGTPTPANSRYAYACLIPGTPTPALFHIRLRLPYSRYVYACLIPGTSTPALFQVRLRLLHLVKWQWNHRDNDMDV